MFCSPHLLSFVYSLIAKTILMFSTDHNLSSLKDLVVEIKEYLGMRYELVKLDLVSKFTILIATLFLCILLLFLLGVTLLFLSYSAAKGIAAAIDNESLAFLIVASFYLVLALVLYLFRKRLIFQPVTRFLCELFLDPKHPKEEENHEQA